MRWKPYAPQLLILTVVGFLIWNIDGSPQEILTMWLLGGIFISLGCIGTTLELIRREIERSYREDA